MRAVVQRVLDAQVQVEGQTVGKISRGLLVYLGVHKDDTDRDFDYILDKVINLRIFSDEAGKMNLSLLDTGGEILVVSQFTLFGDARRGRRPSYGEAAGNEKGNLYYQRFLYALKEKGIPVASGQFGADMKVSYTNDGPVTILLDSFKGF